MYCPECGKELPNGSRFCGNCGVKLDMIPMSDNESLSEDERSADMQSQNRCDQEGKTESDGKSVGDDFSGDRDTESGDGKRPIPKFVLAAAGVIIALGILLFILPGGAGNAGNDNDDEDAIAYLEESDDSDIEGSLDEVETYAEDNEALVEEANDEEEAGEIVAYDNGDVVYIPSGVSLAYDAEEYILYYNDLIIVYLVSDLDDASAASLAAAVGGVVVGDISGIANVLQIQVEVSDLSEIEAMAGILMESENVVYAGYDTPLLPAETYIDDNPWSDGTAEEDRGNEKTPDGNDWWAEAVGAYTAWEIADTLDLSEVTVGILDNGFDLSHEDLTGRISILEGYDINTVSDHGTHVSGIIGAANNDMGIRGIADSAELICVDWDPYSDSNNNLIDTGEYIEIIKQMVENGARVINNSWAETFLSEAAFAEEEGSWQQKLGDILGIIDVDIAEDYASYVKSMEESSTNEAIACLNLIMQFEINEVDQYIIVQSAGNGYDNGGSGIDAFYSGAFCSLNEEIFDGIKQLMSISGVWDQYSYDDIKEHILIVGAVENEQDEDGAYAMTSFSNWGETVDICAPGRSIYSTLTLLDDVGESSNDGAIYGNKSGTSMAAPMVAGAAALLWQIDPDLTAAEVRGLLLDNSAEAVGVGEDEGTIYPMLNIGAAVKTLTGLSGGNDNIDDAYQAFYDKLMELQDTYGKAQLNRTSETITDPAGGGFILYTYYWTGLCFAHLVDMDGDGIEELITGYYDPGTADPTDGQSLLTTAYAIDIWTYADGEIKMVHSQSPSRDGWSAETGAVTCETGAIDGTAYLLYEEISGELTKYECYGLEDESAHRAHYFDASTGIFVVDGQEYDNYEDAIAAANWMNEITDRQYWYFGNQYGLQEDISYFEDEYEEQMMPAKEELDETLATLKEYLGITNADLSESESDIVDWVYIYLELLDDAVVTTYYDVTSNEVYEYEGYDYTFGAFSLIYVNDDDVPELVMHNVGALGNLLFTIGEDGEVDILVTHRRGFEYAEYENIIVNSEGNMDYYYDYVYAIENDKWVQLDYGTRTVTYPEGTDGNLYEVVYAWNDVEVSKEEYHSKISQYTDGRVFTSGYDGEYSLSELD